MKINKLFTAAMIISSVFTVGFNFQAFANVIGTTNSNDINVRAGSNVSSVRIETIGEGTEIQITAQEGDWYKISYDKLDGAYISSQYVDIVQAKGNVIDNDVNVRNAATTSSAVVGKVNKGDTVTITGQNGDWFKIRRSNGETAYLSKSFVTGLLISEVPLFNISEASVVNTYAIVTSKSGLKLREGASTSAASLGVLSYDEVIDVIEAGSEWIKVKTETGAEGYVSKEFVSVRTGEKPSRSASSKGDQVIAYAKNFLGTPYSWGGTNLNKGVDCSGFVYSVMKNFGVTLNRSSSSMASNGVYVERASLRTGDLVFFDTTNATNKGYISHVGIYMGDGKIIHSSSGKQWGVTTNSLSEPYYNTKYVTARRVLR